MFPDLGKMLIRFIVELIEYFFMDKKTEKISTDFLSIQWHDSNILNIQFLPSQNSMICQITINLRLPHKFDIAGVQTNCCQVIYSDCSFWGCSLDLFFLMCSKMSIGSATFYRTLQEIKDKYVLTKISKYSSLSKKYEDEMWFVISLAAPGGEIVISARNFEIIGLAEVS